MIWAAGAVATLALMGLGQWRFLRRVKAGAAGPAVTPQILSLRRPRVAIPVHPPPTTLTPRASANRPGPGADISKRLATGAKASTNVNPAPTAPAITQ